MEAPPPVPAPVPAPVPPPQSPLNTAPIKVEPETPENTMKNGESGKLKRPNPDPSPNPRPAKKANLGKNAAVTKTLNELNISPVAFLNNIRRPLKYCVVSQVGPSHAMIFTVSVMVDGHQYIGSGPSKKQARAAAALKALAVIMQPEAFPEPTSHDFSSDEHNLQLDDDEFSEDLMKPAGENASNAVTNSTPKNKKSPNANSTGKSAEQNKLAINKSPINLIHEKYTNAIFACESIDGNSCLRFKVTCKINDQCYEGFGSSKRSAKLGAAKVALAALGINLPIKSLPKAPEITSPSGLPLTTVPPPLNTTSSLHQSLADRIANAVLDKFNELMSGDTVHIRRKVLAGIVMTYGTNYENMEVIAVSTGTKCVSGERLSTCGLAVNDCHAEVICRRCFQEYIYDCLKDIAESVVIRAFSIGII